MTCLHFRHAIVCVNSYGRLHVGNRYIWVDFHEYCGPSFSYDANGSKPYEPEDENDPVWPAFEKWHAKYEAAKAKRKAAL